MANAHKGKRENVCMERYGTVHAVLHDMVWYSTAQHGTTYCKNPEYEGTAKDNPKHGAAQHSTRAYNASNAKHSA